MSKITFYEKLESLIDKIEIEKWNGGFIKKAIWNKSWYNNDLDKWIDHKSFTYDKIKYKLEIVMESKCDNTNDYNPSFPKITVLDRSKGRYYEDEKIMEILPINDKEYLSLCAKFMPFCVFSEEEILENKLNYSIAMENFKREFCL